MPYRSRAQQRWAHATDQPFASEWDEKTKKLRRGRKRGFAALPEKVGKTSSWGENAAVGKAARDHQGAIGAGGVLAGLGVTRVGGELEHRTHTGIKAADAETARRGTLVALAQSNADARKGKRYERVAPNSRHVQTTAQQREQIDNLKVGVEEARANAARLRAAAPKRLTVARRVKGAGLGLAAMSGVLGLAGARRDAQRRQMGY